MLITKMNSPENGMSTGAMIGIGLGVCFVLALVIGVIYYFVGRQSPSPSPTPPTVGHALYKDKWTCEYTVNSKTINEQFTVNKLSCRHVSEDRTVELAGPKFNCRETPTVWECKIDEREAVYRPVY
jgi:hypothetical protein